MRVRQEKQLAMLVLVLEFEEDQGDRTGATARAMREGFRAIGKEASMQTGAGRCICFGVGLEARKR